MGMGGNPYGPAGTGKTESVKALGGLFGRQVLVFNCDEVRLKMCHQRFYEIHIFRLCTHIWQKLKVDFLSYIQNPPHDVFIL